LSTFRLFHSYESKKVSGRFPDVAQAAHSGFRGQQASNFRHGERSRYVNRLTKLVPAACQNVLLTVKF